MPKTNERITEPLKTLTHLRAMLGLRQKEMVAVLGCSLDTIKSLEQGRLKLSDSLALKISLETGVRPEWLKANSLKTPIQPTFKAMELQENAKIECSHQYSRRTYELVQAHKSDRGSTKEIYDEQLNGLMDLVRLRGIIESAREQHLYELARYKVDRFLNKLEEEFKSDPSRRFLGGAACESTQQPQICCLGSRAGKKHLHSRSL